MPLILPGNVASATAGAYTVANSCRFNFGDSPKLSRAVSTGTANTKFTFSCWFKTSTVNSSYARFLWGGVDSGNETGITLYATSHGSSGAINLYLYGSSSIRSWLTNASHRDPSAWYHMVVRVDTTDATAGDRIQLWVNGTRVTSWNSSSNPDENETFDFFHSNNLTIGREQDSGDRFSFDGYLAEVCVIDGTAYTASDFGEFSSDSPTIWVPKDPSGLTFGTSGFYLDFEDSADLGADVSGNSNDFTATNLAATDQTTDTPTNNFATLNPLDNYYGGATFTEGNCKVTTSANSVSTSTIGVSKGKWYFEAKMTNISSMSAVIGITDAPQLASDAELGTTSTQWAMYGDNSSALLGNGGGWATWGTTYTEGDIMRVALDMDNNRLYIAKDNTWMNSGDPTDGTGKIDITTNTGLMFPAVGAYGNSLHWEVNFGNPPYANSSDAADADGYGKFEFAPPTGYYALCTKNLAEYG